MSEWVYGDILRRAVTMKPLVFQYLMYVGRAQGLYSTRRKYFVGVQLSEYPDPPAGQSYFDPPFVGEVRPKLLREYFELAPEDEQ